MADEVLAAQIALAESALHPPSAPMSPEARVHLLTLIETCEVLTSLQDSGEVTPAAAQRYRQRQLELCADCPQRSTCNRVECVRRAVDPGHEEH